MKWPTASIGNIAKESIPEQKYLGKRDPKIYFYLVILTEANNIIIYYKFNNIKYK